MRRRNAIAELSESLDTAARDLEHVATSSALLERFESLFARLKAAERDDIETALADRAFPFEEAQHDLTECFRTFGKLTVLARDSRLTLSGAARTRVGELAAIGARSRLTGPADLEALRVVHAQRARITAI